jgi:AraC-like DNA-binding protein
MFAAAALRRVADLYLRSCFEAETAPQVGELAAQLGIEAHHLAGRFREVLGCTPSEYLKRQQIAHAQELLRATSLPLNAVGYASGFGTRATFYRAFRRITGMTPAAYRSNPNSK